MSAQRKAVETALANLLNALAPAGPKTKVAAKPKAKPKAKADVAAPKPKRRRKAKRKDSVAFVHKRDMAESTKRQGAMLCIPSKRVALRETAMRWNAVTCPKCKRKR